jgi:delta-aminolevulinic acid dehydratase/porphobilinogen synthase
VDAVSATEIAVKASDGTVTKMAVSSQTAISRVIEAAADELKAGVNVIAAGKAGADGTLAAIMVRLTNDAAQPQGGPGAPGAPSGSSTQR